MKKIKEEIKNLVFILAIILSLGIVCFWPFILFGILIDGKTGLLAELIYLFVSYSITYLYQCKAGIRRPFKERK